MLGSCKVPVKFIVPSKYYHVTIVSIRIEGSIGRGEKTMTNNLVYEFNFGKSKAAIRMENPKKKTVFSFHHEQARKPEPRESTVQIPQIEQFGDTSPVKVTSEIDTLVERMEIQILENQFKGS